MNGVAEITLEALSRLSSVRLPAYAAVLASACESAPPPYGKSEYIDLYQESASDPKWLIGSLLANSLAEGDGSRRLWDLSVNTGDTRVASFIKTHSVDEARHAQWYLAIVSLVFPNSLDRTLSNTAQQLIPKLTLSSDEPARIGSPFAHDITLDDVVQMNIAEIRTRIHHLMQRPFLVEYCPESNRKQLVALLDRLLLDETKHIEYTANIIEDHSRKVGLKVVSCLMHERVVDFNNLTEREMSNREFPSCAQCKKCSMAGSSSTDDA